MKKLHWWGTALYVPVLYGLGWLSARPLSLLFPEWRPDQVNLAGVVVALLLLLMFCHVSREELVLARRACFAITGVHSEQNDVKA